MRKVTFLFVCVLLLGACSSVECPLNNTVFSVYALKGDVSSLTDTLTVSITKQNAKDTVILNKAIDKSSFKLPLSYAQDEDVLTFSMTDTLNVTRTDIVKIKKTNHPHFESVDCGAVFFHTITEVSYTRNAIDSIVISIPEVTYDTSKEHLHIYFKSRD